jgi:hypothetical protein
MPAGSTYSTIATTSLTSTSSTINFNSIPNSYTDLVLIINGNASALADSTLRFNNDSGSNYSIVRVYSTGNGNVFTDRYNSQAEMLIGDFNTSSNTATILHIQNYSNTSTNKTILLRANIANSILFATTGLWRNTAAITSVNIRCAVGAFSVGSTFTLYGIAAA